MVPAPVKDFQSAPPTLRALDGDKSPLVSRADAPKNVRPAAPLTRTSSITGAFINEDPAYLQATGFILNPEGRILTAVYSTGAIGRLVPDDVAGLVRYLKSRA